MVQCAPEPAAPLPGQITTYEEASLHVNRLRFAGRDCRRKVESLGRLLRRYGQVRDVADEVPPPSPPRAIPALEAKEPPP